MAVLVPRTGTDLSIVTPAEEAQHAADIINGQRRRSLNYHHPGQPLHRRLVP
ncbi:MAG: hypothetical protein M5U19_09435 [Microthrixaceae bacterium]|nr:hypothetical protein [Microthrixaceae bacterium]